MLFAKHSICTTLFLNSKSTKRIFYLIAASVVGLSHIWGGVHYPIDVLTAAFIGIAIACSLSSFITRSRVVLSIVNLYDHLTKRVKKAANDQTNISEREG
ncbi:phosphatase PAP2 family protein [Lysinibacillus sp. FSL K6-0232]|uniref:phosphatase PAP2 family protein n=1 Tax=unclassified Lysinibacillus TaxID=2636778 RepID=UPI0030F79E5F